MGSANRLALQFPLEERKTGVSLVDVWGKRKNGGQQIMSLIDWNAMSAPWLNAEAGLEATHQVVLDGLMRRMGDLDGQRILDIGCGTGASLLALADAVGPTGYVTGVDIALPLVARARERAPDHVEVVVSDASAMPFAAPHDAALSLFGTMFFGDTRAAFAHIRKGMQPGARFCFAAWAAPPSNPWFMIPRASVEAAVGPLPKPDPTAPGPFRFANAGAIVDDLAGTGWDVSVETDALSLRTGQTAEKLAEMQGMLSEALMLKDHDVTDAHRADIRANLRESYAAHQTGDQVSIPAKVHFFTAVATS
jgi:SAM-dependent methyltransferase